MSTAFKKKFLKKNYSWAAFRFSSSSKMHDSVREGDILSASVKRVRKEILTSHFNGTFVDFMYLELLTVSFPLRRNTVGRTARLRIPVLGYVNVF